MRQGPPQTLTRDSPLDLPLGHENINFNYSDIFILRPQDLAFLCEKASSEEIRRMNQESQRMLEHAQFLQSTGKFNGTAERISVMDWIRHNPEAFERNKLKERIVDGKIWTERTDFSRPEELEFVRAARKVGQGNFTEILQVTFRTKNQLVKGVTVSGGMDLAPEDIKPLILNLEQQISGPVSAAYVVHNHPDYFAKTQVPKDQAPGILLERNGLSSPDVIFADVLHRYLKRLGNEVTVQMVAVDEMGLTHSYEAGTSK